MHGFEGEYDSGNKHYRRIAEVIMVMYAPRGTAAGRGSYYRVKMGSVGM